MESVVNSVVPGRALNACRCGGIRIRISASISGCLNEQRWCKPTRTLGNDKGHHLL